MHSLSKILVPVDFTASSRVALEYAATLGARFGAEVDMLHVWRPPHAESSKQDLLADFVQTDEGHKMMEWLASFELRSDVEAHGRLAPGSRGDVPEAIVEAARRGSYDLVVMATHGRHGLGHMLRGSVTENVIRRAPCPVVTLRATDDITSAPDPGGADLDARSVWSWPS
jgi:nucleotide-binding universal stress UspA family protein